VFLQVVSHLRGLDLPVEDRKGPPVSDSAPTTRTGPFRA
jgi:hypothetical protein